MSSIYQKMDFLCESATSLHQYGVPAHRLESVIQGLGKRLEIDEVQIVSIPTSIQIYLRSEEEATSRIIRVRPGDLDIEKLQEADAIIENLAVNKISLLDGKKQLIALREQKNRFPIWLEVLSYSLTSSAICLILLTNWVSSGLALAIGLLAGALFISMKASAKFNSVAEIAAGFVASFCTFAAGLFISDLEYARIILACLIIPLPGLTLTIALMDLATEHLVAGTARLMGAIMTLLKIFFGFFLGQGLYESIFGPVQGLSDFTTASQWQVLPGLVVATLSFIVLFRMKPREFPWVLLVSAISFGLHRTVVSLGGAMIASFLAAMAVAFIANTYARLRNRPASTLMIPGLILLVPGSLGYRSLLSMNQKDTLASLDLAFQTLFVGLLIVGGVLIGNFIISPKREL